MIEVVPETLCVEEVHLLFVIAQELAQPRVVEQQPPVLIDDVEAGRAIFEDFTELALVLGDLGHGVVVAGAWIFISHRGGGPVIGHLSLHRRAAPSWAAGLTFRKLPYRKAQRLVLATVRPHAA